MKLDQGNLELQPEVHLAMLASKAAVTNKMQVRTSDFGMNMFDLPTGTAPRRTLTRGCSMPAS